MTCSNFEILIADYVDGTLPEEQRAAVDAHLHHCANCEALARDGAAAIVFMERAAAIEPPPELITRIMFEVANGPGRTVLKSSPLRRWLRNRWIGKWLEPALEPRFAMGMAMTVLSFAMVGQLSGVRQLKPSDLNPVNLWMTAENRVERTWERAVKHYETTRLVYEIQAQLKEWDEDPASGPSGPTSSGPNEGSETR
jgi:hypothetical protein